VRHFDEHKILIDDTSRPRHWCLSAAYRVAFALLLVSVVGCGDDGGASGGAATSGPISKPAAAVPQREDQRPTIILVVLDTTRADSVSAYGEVEGTTPNVDALASTGTRFEYAYAPSPWTVSSHASLFSGLRVDEHGVGLDGIYRAPDEIPMLAEGLRAAGYETAGFAENPLVSSEFGLAQGFDHYEVPKLSDSVKNALSGDLTYEWFDLPRRVAAWQKTRDHSKPAFVFVNIMEAHDPYIVRPTNPWVSSETSRQELDAVVKRHPISNAICRRAPSRADTELLSGLYLGNVHSADAKLGKVLAALESNSAGEPRITIVTSDHGEHLGEHDLMGHRFSTRTPALHIPLVVNGAPDLALGRVSAAVELRSLYASILCWGGLEECDASIVQASQGQSEDPIFSIWSDRSIEFVEPIRRELGISDDVSIVDPSREGCQADDPVFGELVSLIRFPYKVHWSGGQVQGLFDLSWDPLEKSNQLSAAKGRASPLVAELEAFVAENVLNRQEVRPTDLSEDALRTLKALGYVE
jgi:hypothetical protein